MNKMSSAVKFLRPGPVILLSLFLFGGCAGISSETRYDTDTRVYTSHQEGGKSTAGRYDGTTARYVEGKDNSGVKSKVGPNYGATAVYTLRQKGSVPHSEAIRASRGQLVDGGRSADTVASAEQESAIPPMVLELTDVLFEFDKWVIKEPFLPVLDEWVDYFRNNPLVTAEIYGYTDSTGSTSYNQKLSEKRAQAVVNYLVEKGIARDRLTARGFGESAPAAANSTKEGRQKNRRVEMKL